MKLQTINSIELSSICNLACKYCVNRLMVSELTFKAGIMSDEVFNLSLSLLGKLVKAGTQREVNLNGIGESLLDPQLIERVIMTKKVMKDLPVMFCTNGILMDKELARALKDTGIDRVDVSAHDAYHARKCADILTAVGMNGVISDGAIKSSHNWADQLEPEHRVHMNYTIPCHPIIGGHGYINSEGGLSPCCYDYRNLGEFGTVFDENIMDIEIKSFSLCKDCHQILPDGVK
jgi:hypothetical protein